MKNSKIKGVISEITPYLFSYYNKLNVVLNNL